MKCVELLLLFLSRGVEPRGFVYADETMSHGWKNRSMYVGQFSQEKTYCFVELQWFPGVGKGEWEEGFGWL